MVFTVAVHAVLMRFSLWIDKPEATKDSLPFATALVGFLGGLITSMFKQDGAESGPERISS